ncbi:MAG TPA: radical SAM protein [Chromatiaceae bacterium]|nr:radical SAM protein [Chromatiaceae bacterium]
MSTPAPIPTTDAGQQALLPIYLATMRQRFKAETNRLTSGAMRELLGEHPEAELLAFPLSYLYMFHWLRHNVPAVYFEPLLSAFRQPARLFLMRLLVAETPEAFVSGYIAYWRDQTDPGPLQQAQLSSLLTARGGDAEALAADMLAAWRALDLFQKSHKVAYAELARHERKRYDEMLGDADRERLARVDALPDPRPARQRFAKLGVIPAMGCPQTCRHCMFIWRPPRAREADPERIHQLVDSLTDSVLFTGGDLSNHLEHFHAAIHAMRHVVNFAILLNGDFADDPATTEGVLKRMAEAVDARPAHWPKARVLLQISFDEFHQEVYIDKKGRLRERIPVAKIANIVEIAPRFANRIQLALLHKQTRLNFSMDVLQKGVFARLVNELGTRGHQVEVLSTAPSTRLKRHPDKPDTPAPVLKDASFVLSRHPDAPILLTSSTIDGYGRAETLDESETVKEKDLLRQVITAGPPPGEHFDIDPMFWFNGWVTLFNAVHISLGNLYEDGADKILARQRKDPLSHALHRFDRALLDLYAEIRDDLDKLIDKATGPHHLFHMLTEEPAVRLHMTRRLIETA